MESPKSPVGHIFALAHVALATRAVLGAEVAVFIGLLPQNGETTALPFRAVLEREVGQLLTTGEPLVMSFLEPSPPSPVALIFDLWRGRAELLEEALHGTVGRGTARRLRSTRATTGVAADLSPLPGHAGFEAPLVLLEGDVLLS